MKKKKKSWRGVCSSEQAQNQARLRYADGVGGKGNDALGNRFL